MNELSISRTQQISLEILKQITDICENNNLRYSLIYGTLIGAVRHHGFIPWDDDVDIMMPRPDYDELLSYLSAHLHEYPHLEVFNPETCDRYPYMITRISDNRYWIDVENEKPYGMGVFIDIYPFDGLGNDQDDALKFALKGDHLSSCCYQASREYFSIENTRSITRKIIKFPVYLYSKIRGKNYFQKKLERLARVRNYDNSRFVGCVTWLSGGAKDMFLREWFDETIIVSFEKYQFRIPKDYDTILHHIYGDYMILPPKNERIGHHHYKVYQK